jgi:hypothetical protein
MWFDQRIVTIDSSSATHSELERPAFKELTSMRESIDKFAVLGQLLDDSSMILYRFTLYNRGC